MKYDDDGQSEMSLVSTFICISAASAKRFLLVPQWLGFITKSSHSASAEDINLPPVQSSQMNVL